MLDHKVGIYVPGTTAVNVPAPTLQEQWTNEALERFSRWFGGATALPGIGAWLSPTCGLVREPIMCVFSFTDDATARRNLDAVMALAAQIAFEMGQEVVTVEVNGGLHLVTAAAATAS
jgi:hypothetical protein